ncbi:MAG: ABC transporter substrate-binding protein [Pseudomonadota bacterium]
MLKSDKVDAVQWLSLGTAVVVMVMGTLLLVGCSAEEPPAAANEPQLTKILLQTDWYAEPEHGGFYLAMIDGYYREVGLDVEIRPLSTQVSPYAVVASDQAQMALGTSDNLLIALGQGIPLKGVFPYFQHDPQGVMYHAESGIKKLQDLDGRTVMISPILHYVDFLDRALDIQMNMIPVDGSVAHFIQDKQFAQQAFLTSEPYAAIQGGADPQVLPFWDTGYDPYRLVFTSASFAAEHPEAVKAFIAASIKGWEAFMTQDKTAIYAEIIKRNPSQTPESAAWSFDKMQEYELTHGHTNHQETLGQVSVPRLQTQIDQLTELELLNKPVSVDDVMVFDLYPPELIVR